MFKEQNFCHIASNNRNNVKVGVFVYRTSDDLATVTVSGYFNERIIDINLHDIIIHEKIDPVDSTVVQRNTLCVVKRTVDNVETKEIHSAWEELTDQAIQDIQNALANITLNDLTDVNITNVQVGDYLRWNGAEWINMAGGGGGSSVWGSIGGDIADQADLQTALGNKANVDLDNLSATGQAKFDAKQNLIGGGTSGTLITNTGTPGTVSETSIDGSVTQGSNNPVSSDAVFNAIQGSIGTLGLTNCITEILQDIKLELNAGVLTLKAGSKIYVPNGVGVFDEITIANDISYDFSAWGTTRRLLTLNTNTNTLEGYELDTQTASGNTQPVVSYTYMTWYDTANNLIKYTSDSGSTWTSGGSLPLAIFSGGNSRLYQIFNGFGYIGSTVFVLPGIKYLVPDGLNADGTYKNIASTISNVLTLTVGVSGWAGMWNIYCHGTYISAHPTVLEIISNSPPTVSTATAYWYNPQTNFMYWTADTGATWTKTTVFSIGKFIENSTRITNLNGKPTFHAVDFSTFGQIVSFRLPYYDNSRSWFVKWSNGIVIQGQQISTQNATITYPVPMANTDYFLGGVGFTISNIGAQTITSRTTTGFTTGSNVQNSSTLGYWVFGKYA